MKRADFDTLALWLAATASTNGTDILLALSLSKWLKDHYSRFDEIKFLTLVIKYYYQPSPPCDRR